MAYTPILIGRVDAAGRVDPDLREQIRAALQSHAGRAVEITIRRWKHTTTRSNSQNKYYWGVVLPTIGNHIGYTSDEMHEALKWKFLRKPDSQTWEGVATVRSSKELDTLEFEEYLENVRRFAATDLGVTVPLPNEVEIT
jgi:hypothetical protein